MAVQECTGVSQPRPHGGPAPSRHYERRRPKKTPLHVSENLESGLARREAGERPVPGSVEEELRGYLECGLLCSAADKGRISRDIVAEAALTGHGVRLWICPAGVIQRHPLKSETLKRMGPGDNLTVTPAYCNRPHEAVVAVLKAVQDRQIAVRTETVWKR